MARPRRPVRNPAAQSWCAEVRRFLRLINADEVLGTHRVMSAWGHSRHSQLAPKSTFVRCWSNRRQNLVPSICPRSATSGLMHRSKPHFYSITSSARASSLAGISRYYGAIATSVFNDLDYIFLAPNWKRLVPDQKPLGELRPGPTYMAGRSKPSSRINIKTFQVGQQTGSTVWPRYAQVTTL